MHETDPFLDWANSRFPYAYGTLLRDAWNAGVKWQQDQQSKCCVERKPPKDIQPKETK